MEVSRAGSNRSPRSRPASAAKATGAYGRPVGGGPDLPRSGAARGTARAVERRGDHADGVHRRGLALVVGGADGGVALDVLDAAHPGAGGPEDVGDGLVTLQVDEVAVEFGEVAVASGDDPQRPGDAGRLRILSRHREGMLPAAGDEAGNERSGRPGPGPLGQASVQGESAAGGAHDLLALRPRRSARTRPARRPSAACPAVGCAGGRPGSNHRRRRPGRTRSRSGVPTGVPWSSITLIEADVTRGSPVVSTTVAVGMTSMPAVLGGAGRVGQGGSGVGDGRDLDAGREELGQHRVRAVVGGGHDDPGAGSHAVPVQVACGPPRPA